MKIVVAGTGYGGLSVATFLSRHHQVKAVDIILEKATLINDRKSSIQDEYIENTTRKGNESDSHLSCKKLPTAMWTLWRLRSLRTVTEVLNVLIPQTSRISLRL